MKKTIALLFLLTSASLFGQTLPPKTQFGVQVRAIVPTKFIDGDNLVLGEGRFDATISQAPAGSIGFLIRQRLNDTFTIETGIQYNRRRFDVKVNDNQINFQDAFTLRMVSYEIPLNALLYVRTGQQSWINTSAGGVFNFFPSDLERFGPDYGVQLRTGTWIKMGLAVNVGFEYRTKDNGSFYTGIGYHRSLSPTAQARFFYQPEVGQIFRVDGNIEGSFLSLDFRYFFNE